MRMKRKTILKSVVLAALCFGVSGISQAANYETVLIGTEADKKVMGDTMKIDGRTSSYTFKEDTTITARFNWQDMVKDPYYIDTGKQGYIGAIQPGGMYSDGYKPKGPQQDMIFNMNGHNLTVYNYTDTGIGKVDPQKPGQGAYVGTTAVWVSTPNKVEINDVNKADFILNATGYYVSGLYAGYYRGLGNEEKELADRRPGLYIHNKPGWEHAVRCFSDGAQYKENITGVKIFNRGELIIDGYIDFYRQVTEKGKKVDKYWGLDVNTMGNGWKEYSAHFKTAGGRWGGLYLYGKSLLELNTEMDDKGNVKALGNEVQMVGDVSYNTSWSRDEPAVDLAITGKNSFWRGLNSSNKYEVRNLFLTDGGRWEQAGGKIHSFHGGKTEKESGIIFIKNARFNHGVINIADYEGWSTLMVNRQEPGAGHLEIASAKKGSGVIVQTNSEGLDITDDKKVNGVLEDLAGRLIYTGYTHGENNLSGKVKIAEGLTTESAEKKVGTISFNPSTGEGYYLKQLKTDFTTTLTGQMAVDQEYVDANVILSEGVVKAKKPSTIKVKDKAAIGTSEGHALRVDLNRQDWTAESERNGGATIEATGKDGTAEIVFDHQFKIVSKGTGDLVGIHAVDTTKDGQKQLQGISMKMNNGANLKEEQEKNKGLLFKAELTGEGTYTAVRADKGSKIGLIGYLDFDLEKVPKATLLEARDGGEVSVKSANNKYNRQLADGKSEMIDGFYTISQLQTKGYMAKALNGGKVTLGGAQGWKTRGDIYTEKGEQGVGEVTLNVASYGGEWYGGAHGNGKFTLRLDPTSYSSDRVAKNIWHNEWQQESLRGTSSEITQTIFSGVSTGKEPWIFQKDAGDIRIKEFDPVSSSWGKLQSNLYVYYEHDQNIPSKIIGGDLIIDKVTSGKEGGEALVHLRTGPMGIDLTNKEQLNTVFSSLAKKLVYMDYTNGKRAVTGTVGIAEGILTSSATKMINVKDIGFDKTGRGLYLAQKANLFTVPITGGEDKPYADALVKNGANYIFNEDSTIAVTSDKEIAGLYLADSANLNINSTNAKLTISADGTKNMAGVVAGILVKNDGTLVQHTGDLNISVKGDKKVYGILAEGDGEGKTQTITIDTRAQGFLHNEKRIKITGESSVKDGFTAVAANHGGKIFIESSMDVSGKEGILFYADHKGKIDVQAGGEVERPEYSTGAPIGCTFHMGKGILAQAGRGGDINISTAYQGTSLIGDVYTDIDGEAGKVSILLGNDGTWHGGIKGTGISELTLYGSYKLIKQGEDYLETDWKKSVWTNEWEAGEGGAYVSKINGGTSSGGIVYQKSPEKLTVDSLKGSICIRYDHDKSNPAKLIGGDIVINKAEKLGWSNPSVIILTGKEGIDYTNELTRGKVFNNLASKVYYHGESNTLYGYLSLRNNMFDDNEKMVGKDGEVIAPHSRYFNVHFNSKTGQGYYYYEAPEQIANAFTTTLTGHNKIKDTNKRTNTADYQYAQGGVIHKETGVYEFKTKGNTVANTIHVGDKNTITYGEAATPKTATAAIAAQDLDITLSAENTLDIKAKAETDKQNAVGIYTGKDKTLALTADDLEITAQAEKGKAYGIYNEGTLTHKGKLTVKEADTALWNKQGTVTLDTANMTANENGIIGEQGTTTSVHNLSLRMKDHKTAVETKGGTITIAKDENKPGNVDLKGDIRLNGKGMVDLTLKGQGNNWEGTLKNSDGTMNLTLQDNGVWNNKNDMREDGTYINKLVGAKDKQKAGTIIQNNPSDMIIDNYQGHTKVLYAHDKENPKTVIGGNITINAAEKESGITLLTDRENIGLGNDAITPVLEALANKLTYKDAVQNKDNLKGEVGLTESLTESSAIIKLSDLEFDKNGKGHLKGNIYDVYEDGTKEVHTGDIVYGNKQTAMMRGAKSAMLATSMIWRATNNDVQKRMGDLRQGTENETGAWGRIGGGKMTFDKDGGQFKTTFTDYMAGYDKQIGKDKTTRAGIAVGYIRGNDSYEKGTGKSHLTTINLYTTKINSDGTYFDIIARAGKLKNKYTVYNDYGKTLKGDYKTNGYSLSLEYGKRIEKEDGKYLEPSAELTWGRIEGKTYEAQSDYAGGTALAIDQEAYDSLIGRIGMKAGIRKQNKSAYIGLSLEHEFQGDFDTGYKTAGEKAKTTHMNLKGTWLNISLGGTYTLSENRYIYGTVEKDFGGDIQTDWRINAGMRLRF